MPRQNQQEELTAALHTYLAEASKHSPEDYPLASRSVAKVLGVSPTTLYKYGLNRQINAAEQRQRENGFIAGAAIEQDYFKGEIRKLTEELEKERERSKGLVGRIAIMEANAARLGFDPEEMHKAILKPLMDFFAARGRLPDIDELPETAAVIETASCSSEETFSETQFLTETLF